MPIFWFLAGCLTTLAALIVMLPRLRKLPRFEALPALPWQASAAAILIVVATFGLHHWLGAAELAGTPPAPGAKDSTTAFSDATKVFANASGTDAAGLSGSAAPKAPASSMNSAIASLEARLAKGGGTDGDWELLAKSFEFLSRPADAAQARAHHLPPLPTDSDAPAPASTAPMLSSAPTMSSAPMASSTSGTSGTAVSGEITLAPALKAKAAVGETLFIVAKSVDAPGAPVAVIRASVGSWPLKFTLDDSQSMMPGRNLSSAGRVTIEARISQKGQPLPASGDLQGSTGVINPADRQPLKILIDRVIS